MRSRRLFSIPRLDKAVCWLLLVALNVSASPALAKSSDPPPAPALPYNCATTRPATPPVDNTDASKGLMVVGPSQVAFDLCKLASQVSIVALPGPLDWSIDMEERMRTIALEAYFMHWCPIPKTASDDPNQSTQDFTDTHEWGCGPYISESKPTPPVQTPFDNPCNLKPARPYSWLLGMHPPVDQALMVYDLCVAASELDSAPRNRPANPSMSIPALPNATASVTDNGNVLWEIRFAHIFTEVHLYLTCSQGRHLPTPPDTDSDYALNRNFGCGPYKGP